MTIGDNGLLNHAWLANPGSYIIPNRHWQGGPPGYGVPLHPSRVLWTWPPVYEFARPIRGTFPPWTDPSYWYEGLRYHVDSAAEWRTAKHNVLFYIGMFGGWLLTGCVAVLLVAGDLRSTAAAVARHMRYLAPAVMGLVIYGLANDLLPQDQPTPQPPSRYVAVYVVLLVLFLAASIRFRPRARRSRARFALAFALGAVSVGAVTTIGADQRAGLGKAAVAAEPWRLAEDLRNEGVAATMRVAIIGSPSRHDLWARLARVRIVAEVPNEASFWAQPAAAQQDILQALANAGVSVVVARARAADGPRARVAPDEIRLRCLLAGRRRASRRPSYAAGCGVRRMNLPPLVGGSVAGPSGRSPVSARTYCLWCGLMVANSSFRLLMVIGLGAYSLPMRVMTDSGSALANMSSGHVKRGPLIFRSL